MKQIIIKKINKIFITKLNRKPSVFELEKYYKIFNSNNFKKEINLLTNIELNKRKNEENKNLEVEKSEPKKQESKKSESKKSESKKPESKKPEPKKPEPKKQIVSEEKNDCIIDIKKEIKLIEDKLIINKQKLEIAKGNIVLGDYSILINEKICEYNNLIKKDFNENQIININNRINLNKKKWFSILKDEELEIKNKNKLIFNLNRKINRIYCDSIDIFDINNKINNLINNSKPFFCHRSRSEDRMVYKIMNLQKLTKDDLKLLNINCGVYPKDDLDIIQKYSDEYIKVFENLDIFCYHYVNDLNIFKFFSHNKIIGNFVNSSYPNRLGNNWLNNLVNKKVLIISSIPDTLKLAYETIDLKFKKFKKIIFYKCVQSIGNNNVHSNWYESLEIMKKEIKILDFDIALLSCGGYSGPIGLYIKDKLNKQAVNMGGSLQYQFNVIGGRWNIKNGIKVLEHEIPKNFKQVENGCYW